MRQKLTVCLILWLMAAILTSCLPSGGAFGHGDPAPRPEFSGSPMADVEEMEG